MMNFKPQKNANIVNNSHELYDTLLSYSVAVLVDLYIVFLHTNPDVSHGDAAAEQHD